MQDYRKRLPNLDLLITFDAVSRHESFTRAAEELSLTQSAVSQRIRLLEESMGISLFERFHKAIKLTRAGAEFHNSVIVALNHLVSASETIQSSLTNPRFRIAADVALCDCWLKPRLAQLQSLLPGIEIELIATDDGDAHRNPAIDLAITHGSGVWPGYESTFLFRECVFPVCSPGYLDKYGPIESLAQLSSLDLIDLTYEKWTWMNWTIWLAESGITLSSPKRIFRSNLYSATMDAAKQGMGIALAWENFVQSDIESGRLVTPVLKTVKTENGYFIITSEHMANTPTVKVMRNWLADQVV